MGNWSEGILRHWENFSDGKSSGKDSIAFSYSGTASEFVCSLFSGSSLIFWSDFTSFEGETLSSIHGSDELFAVIVVVNSDKITKV
jgi:hypothetical protein